MTPMSITPTQTIFYCVGRAGKHTHKETALRVVKTEVTPKGGDDIVQVTFQCDRCQSRFIYRASWSTIQSFLPTGQKPR
jgi:hypothetical protein